MRNSINDKVWAWVKWYLPFYLFTFLPVKWYLPFYLFAFLPLTFSGCIDEFEADIPSEDTNLLVVEGTIRSSEQNVFYLSRSQPITLPQWDSFYGRPVSDNPLMITGATVCVRGSDGSEYVATEYHYVDSLTLEYEPGVYSCKIDTLFPDVEYYLHIEADGEVYESEPQKPLRTEKIADVRGVQNTPDSHIDVLVTPEVPFESGKANYYTWTYDETWEVRPEYQTRMYFDTKTLKCTYKADLFPYCGWKDAKNTEILVGASSNYVGHHIQRLRMYGIDNGDERIYYRYSGLVHQRAITKAEYEYELARRQAGSEMGGLFTPQPSSLPTNIHCLTSGKRVIGYVGCSLNTSKYRFFLKATDYTVRRPHHEDSRVWLINPSETECCKLVARGMYPCVWRDERMAGGVLETAWAYAHQVDVRYEGAYVEEPEFWSLTENVSY